MNRNDQRSQDELRPVEITLGIQSYAEGSVLIKAGDTHVICSASIEESVPNFLKDQNKGWITAEYNMLPRATLTRTRRENIKKGRTHEIQRLIGRCLRTSVDLNSIGERSILIDCDVVQADGGTRTASITGSYVALYLAVLSLVEENKIEKMPAINQLAAVSVGILKQQVLLDLCYEEDSEADADFNIVMNNNGDFIEVQGTAEQKPYSKELLDEVLSVGSNGIKQLFDKQNEAISYMTQIKN
jgi:ribonuclease PH|tara:strand:- start:86 stop:814 length:729 start_codon:yes stop_codon:yes gene_type:complete